MKTWFGNLKIGAKITCGFLVVALIAGIIGLVGVINLENVDGSYSVAYRDTTEALEYTQAVDNYFQKMRANIYRIVLTDDMKDKQETVATIVSLTVSMQESIESFKGMLAKYKTEEAAEELALIDDVKNALDAYSAKTSELLSGLAMDPARKAQAYAFINEEIVPYRAAVDNAITALIDYNHTYANNQIAANAKLVMSAEFIMVAFIVGGVLLAVLIGVLFARDISRRIKVVVVANEKLVQGDFDVNIDINAKDEIGVLAESSRRMSGTLKTIIQDLSMGFSAFADGNFAVDTQAENYYVGGYYPLMVSIREMRDKLSETLRTINIAAEQVSSGSEQVSSGAQALATGSTEQAASVQELTASVDHIAEQALENAAMIEHAAKSIQQSDEGISAGNRHMDQLTKSMEEIGAASNQIANITKVIEDIVPSRPIFWRLTRPLRPPGRVTQARALPLWRTRYAPWPQSREKRPSKRRS